MTSTLPPPTTSLLGRGRSISTPPRPTPDYGPKWISSVLPTPPDSDTNEENEAAPLKRPARHFAAFDLGFIPLTGITSKVETERREKCYEELEEEPEMPSTPCVKLKDGRELRPLLKHRKRSASQYAPKAVKWHEIPTPKSSFGTRPASPISPDHESEHAHVHFSDTLENVCIFDESAPAHDSDPTHSPLEPPKQRSLPSSPRIRTKQLRLPGTVIASPTHRAALGFTSSPASATIRGREVHLKLACDSCLPTLTPETAPTDGMLHTLNVRLSQYEDNLTGIARVRNIAFEKQVCVVYTTDDWATRREVSSRWTDRAQAPEGWDDFEFNIPLSDVGIQASAGSAVRAKILRFAVRYRVPGHGEWWDNRDGANWVARFRAASDF